MTLNSKTWLNWDVRKPCPTCKIGTLIPDLKKSTISETASSLDINDDTSLNFEHEYVFTAHLTCNHCKETVVASGDFFTSEYYDDEVSVYKTFVPKLFWPPPHIIEISPSTPKSVKDILIVSFGLYWYDVSSCANKIRIAVEVLMDELSVVKVKSSKNGKATPLDLHSRILEYKKTNPEAADFLLSIKWIGNAGSHFCEITKENCLTAFEILEYTLETIYKDKQKKISQLSNAINIKKRP